MTARRLLLPLAVLALVAAAFALPFGSSSNSNANAVVASTPPTLGYTIVSNGAGLCDLVTIDLATGTLTNLPAPSSEAACADDLAVAPDGTIYGIAGFRFFAAGSVTPMRDSVGPPELITFSATGVPSGQLLTVDDAPIDGISGGSIAVDATGTMYIIAINEPTCDPRLNAPGSFDPSDTVAFNCLYTVDIASGALTQVGEGFSPNQPVFGLASCGSTLLSQVPGLMAPLNGNQPATIGLPWASIDPTTGVPTEEGISTQIFGFDCVANGNTVYAMSAYFSGPVPTSVEPQGVAPSGLRLGTVDPLTGVFTETVTISDSTAIFPYASYAVAPVPVVPEPVVPEPVVPNFTH